MKRRHFIKTVSALTVTAATMKLNAINQLANSGKSTQAMPLLFLGHGSPMNAIEDNAFTREFKAVAGKFEKPRAILVVSAHWETRGTFVTAMEHPPTIHDFGGFPQALFDVQYPAPGSPELAKETQQLIKTADVGLNDQWGLDHGAWSVIRHMYPDADIPVVQLSLDYTQGAQYHYELGQQLAALRERGVLIVGSGNLIHNLRMVAWDKLELSEYGYDWALEAQDKMNRFILEGDHQSLIDYRKQGRAFSLSIPTPDHYLPLLYVLGLKDEKDKLSLFNDKAVGGSLSMTSVFINKE
ncbi:4,5-DOPA-extradiol-dioxygenase [Carboxylicivirga linearis]|uniref:4,5-DOPA dioxygenase extradiol n=1 Tax=Carboxylicivirga linearis TaxID=1628157 RepID=A0ABS5JSG5_9BACT|nr:4,5-DOPA dioxygenase extradiol [Carboxylicivirga linearis]MBS2097848.1 4,5-DOPA dioxygenase extradiol [Carboxylicivirga linearis]